jgi:hypothetical protein
MLKIILKEKLRTIILFKSTILRNQFIEEYSFNIRYIRTDCETNLKGFQTFS